jgi:hypothetical protein
MFLYLRRRQVGFGCSPTGVADRPLDKHALAEHVQRSASARLSASTKIVLLWAVDRPTGRSFPDVTAGHIAVFRVTRLCVVG